MSSQVRIIKTTIARQEKSVTIPPISDREYWVEMRNLLLQQLALIEKRLGISRRCKSCGENVSG